MEYGLTTEIEKKLDSFDSSDRKDALNQLKEMVDSAKVSLPEPTAETNVHYHSFYSYNYMGYSPAKLAWLGRKEGLAVAGVVDFDVLDGLEEYLYAAKLFGLKATVGMETRVFVPDLADKVINSPGEPGVAYNVGIGFTKAEFAAEKQKFLNSLKDTAQERNISLTERVNKFLAPVELDYDKDVLELTPASNPTERHICLAYARKARSVFADDKALADFWSEKFGTDASQLELPEGKGLINALRAKTMKQGGIGYVAPGVGSFPTMQEFNDFVIKAGALPVLTWLDGTSDGEGDIEKLFEVNIAAGAAIVNIIPDRNFAVGVDDEKLANLREIIAYASEKEMPIVVGTEMNSPGQRFIDDFKSAELSPFVDLFRKGALVVYAHTALQRYAKMGYLSDWAKQKFANVAEKNRFFEKLGEILRPCQQEKLAQLDENIAPEEIINLFK